MALVLGIPLALAAFDFPAIEAMNLSVDSLSLSAKTRATLMPIFTTQKVRAQFLDPQPQALTLEVAKEEFFRTHVPYGDIIYSEALRNDLSPELVAAVVETESDFKVRLISRKNAQGLMQIIPETAQLLGVKDPFDPHQNIAAGTRYLRYLMDRFSDPRLALAAYNAGETKVARLGTIPQYEETLSYVEKVNSRARSYSQRVRRSYYAASRMRVAY
jgi:soluble lytic murein transglycosylase-like protein